MSNKSSSTPLNPHKRNLIAMVGAGFVAGIFALASLWLAMSGYGLSGAVLAAMVLFCAIAALLIAFRLYASLSLKLAQNDQKHLQNALIQAKDMLDSSKKLREDYILLRSLTQNLPFPIWLKDRFGRYLVTNNAFVKEWCNGVDPTGKTDNELLNQQLAEAFASADQQVLNTLKPNRLELKLDVTGKKPKWVNIERFALLGDNNKVVGALGFAQDITGYKSVARQPQFTDPLTGFANLQGLNEHIRQDSNRETDALCLHIDLDHFKVLNDSLGKDTGDKLLQSVAKRISQASPAGAFLARVSADEFVAIWPQHADRETEIDALLELIKQPISIAENQYSFTASVGAAAAPEHGETLAAIEQNASIALFNAKKLGRNQLHWYHDDYEHQAKRRLNKEQMLRTAIKNQAFEIHVQPRVNCKTREIEALECLIRLVNEQGDIQYPNAFLSLAESNGLIKQLDIYMLEQAMAQIQQWLNDSVQPTTLAVNLSLQSINGALINHLSRWHVKEPRVFQYLELELTEHRLPEHNESFLALLHEIRDFGITLSLDDFGTGYANLSRLPEWPFQILKLDRTFVAHLIESDKQQTVVKSIIEMCSNLNIHVVAEGIETEAELELIDALGCHSIQGFVYAKPRPFREADEWLKHKTLIIQ